MVPLTLWLKTNTITHIQPAEKETLRLGRDIITGVLGAADPAEEKQGQQ